MKRPLIAFALTLATAGAQAEIRPSTVDRPCRASRQLVIAKGAVVLGTGGFTFDRFVRDDRFCQLDEYPEPAFVPSRDTPRCFVGYRCRTGPRDLFGD